MTLSLCLTEEFWGEVWAGLQALGERRTLLCLELQRGQQRGLHLHGGLKQHGESPKDKDEGLSDCFGGRRQLQKKGKKHSRDCLSTNPGGWAGLLYLGLSIYRGY